MNPLFAPAMTEALGYAMIHPWAVGSIALGHELFDFFLALVHDCATLARSLPSWMKFLTVKEATAFTGKSTSTIKRLIREVITDPNHHDREQVLPPHEEVEERRLAGEPYSWKISEELLLSRYPQEADSNETKDSASQSGGVIEQDRLVSVLEKSISVLESELVAKNSQIAQFQERQREQNLLLKQLQEQLAISAPKATESKVETDVVSADESASAVTADEPQKSRQSIWTREFHLFGLRRN